MDFSTMKNPDLVAYALSKGHKVRGLNRDRIIELLTVVPVESIVLPDEEATLCAKRSCSQRIAVETMSSTQAVLAPKIVAEPKTDSKPKTERKVSDWDLVRIKAKELGISVHGKKRPQIEAEIKEQSNDRD